MALTFFWRCEGTTLSGTDDYSDGDTTATLNGTAAINTDAVRIGTNGLDIPSGTSSAEFAVSTSDLAAPGEGSLAFSFYMPTSWSTDTVLVNISNSGGDYIRVNAESGGFLRFRYLTFGEGSYQFTTSGTALSADTWYGVVARWNQAASDRRIEIYNASGTLIDSEEDLTTAYVVSNAYDTVTWGEVGAASGGYYLDNVFLGDAYSEPLEDNLTITSYTEYGAGGTSVGKLIGGGLVR